MYKLILTGTVTSTPEKYYSINNDEYLLIFKFRCFINSKLDGDEFEIICRSKFLTIAESYVSIGANLLIEGSPTIYAKKHNIAHATGTIRVLVSSIQFLDSELHIDESDSIEVLELLSTLKSNL